MAEEDLIERSVGIRHETENGERMNGTDKVYLDKSGRFIDGTAGFYRRPSPYSGLHAQHACRDDRLTAPANVC